MAEEAERNFSESTHYGPTRKRGGAAGSITHVLLMIITTIVLLASSWCLVTHHWIAGFVLLIVGIVLCFINPQK